MLYAGYSVFHLYMFAQLHTLVIIWLEEFEFGTLLYADYLDTQYGAKFARGAELTGGLGDLYTGHVTHLGQ